MPELTITSLRGGVNDRDPPTELADDQCVTATNVEFVQSTLGERRKGATAIDVSGGDLATCTRIVWLHRHLPSADESAAQLWALGITDGTPDTATLAYKDTTWHTVSVSDAFTLDGISEHQVHGVSLHGKLFIAYNSAVDYLHVWDGTSFRRCGLIAPSAAPTGADSGGAGSLASTRYYRVRETVKSGSTTLIRSEPSAVLTHAPSGSNASITVTKPATTNSNATHWELEASLDAANYYVLATTVVGTTTVVDSTAAATGYAGGVLSEDIGDYLPPHSAKRLLADEDRLLLFGSWEDTDAQSSVSWTPTANATGVGNDERITLDPVSTLNLNGAEGGEIQDVGRWTAGEVAAFKSGHIYRLTRTGNRLQAYTAVAESKAIGAIRGSVVEGVDEQGASALFFLDPALGPYRFSIRGGLQYCGADVQGLWESINLDAVQVVARSLYYPTKRQVHWRIATGAADVPSRGLVLHTNAQRPSPGGDVRRGFVIWTGNQVAAQAMCLYADNIDDDTARSRTLVPHIGLTGGIWRCDTTDADNGTAFTATITTKPFAPVTVQSHIEVRSATLVAKAVDGAVLTLAAIPDGGTATTRTSSVIDCTPETSETFVLRSVDELGIAECRTVQFTFADVATPVARWELARLVATITTGQRA